MKRNKISCYKSRENILQNERGNFTNQTVMVPAWLTIQSSAEQGEKRYAPRSIDSNQPYPQEKLDKWIQVQALD